MSEDISDQDIAAFEQWLERRDKAYQSRNEQPYDGVLGRLPEWVPEPCQTDFENTRNRLLDSGAYGQPIDPSVARGYLDIYKRLGEGIDSTVAKPGEQRDGLPEWIPPEVKQDVEYLAHVRWCVSIGEDRGLKELSGSMAARGAEVTRGRQKGGEKSAKARRAQSEAERIVKAARRELRNGKPRRGLAAKLKKGYGFCLGVKQINRILNQAGL